MQLDFSLKREVEKGKNEQNKNKLILKVQLSKTIF